MTIHAHDRAAQGAANGTTNNDPQIYFDRALAILENADVLATTKTWTRARQAGFLAKIAEGATVKQAADEVGVVERSAYSFRRRVAGTSFDVGWRAGRLLARDRLDDELYRRCMEGQEVVTETAMTTPDGDTTRSVTRHLHDNRLALAMLTRLDRIAEDRSAPGAHVAQLVAMDYDNYLARVATGAPIEPYLRSLARALADVEATSLAAPLPGEEEEYDDEPW